MAEFKPTFDGPLGGEAWTFERKSKPWDAPPQFADSEQALRRTFRRLLTPKMTKQVLNMMELGLPIDYAVEGVLLEGFRQGKFGAPAMTMMVGPLTVIMWRMAESAGIRPILSNELPGKVDFDPSDLLAAQKRVSNNTENKAIHAGEISEKELLKKDVMDRQGFVKFRPKRITRAT